MRHGKSGKKLGRTPSHRKALFRNMVTSLLKHERILTTEIKAKEIGRLTEKMITLGKRGDLHARRQAISFIKSNEVVKRLFSVYAERYKSRDGGYTRVIKVEPRSGDNAPMAIVELVDRPIETKVEGKKEKASKAAKPKAKPKTAKLKAAKPTKELRPRKNLPGKPQPKKTKVMTKKVLKNLQRKLLQPRSSQPQLKREKRTDTFLCILPNKREQGCKPLLFVF